MTGRKEFGLLFEDTFFDVESRDFTAHSPDLNPSGASWALGSGSPSPAMTGTILSNQLQLTDNGDGSGRYFTIEMLENNGVLELECFVGNAINPAWPQIMFRDDGADLWTLRQNAESNVAQLFNPAGSILDSVSLTSGVNDELFMQVVMNDDLIVCTVRNKTTDTEVQIGIVDSTNQLATEHGVGARTTFGAGASDRYDNFKFLSL